MLKYALLAGAMIVAAPAIAQTAANPTPGAPTGAQTAPMGTATPDATTTTAAPASPSAATPQTAPATTAQVAPAQTTATPTDAAPVQQAASQPTVTGDQVAQVVDSEFPTYDTNKDGKLNATEFSAWMVALKTKTDPATKAGSPETKKWVSAAFTQADTDKNKSLSKTELTGFLSQGQS